MARLGRYATAPAWDKGRMTEDAGQTPWRIGENVPWVAAWTGEADFDIARSIDFPGRMELVQASRPGVGQPVLDGMHVMRQREGVTGHLCHVCGTPTPRRDRWLFPVVTGIFMPFRDGTERYASHLPPVHLACARRAQVLCPHLRTRYAQPVRYPDKDVDVLCETTAPPKMADIAAQLPPGMKVVYSYYRLHTAGFTRLVQRLRAAHEAAHGPA
jgi:hypothetical protein